MALGQPDEDVIEATLTADGGQTILVWEEELRRGRAPGGLPGAPSRRLPGRLRRPLGEGSMTRTVARLSRYPPLPPDRNSLMTQPAALAIVRCVAALLRIQQSSWPRTDAHQSTHTPQGLLVTILPPKAPRHDHQAAHRDRALRPGGLFAIDIR
jgi:hypothetical protein